MKKFLMAPALGLVFAANAAWAAQDINVGISGSWFNANKPGHGFAIEYTANPQSCADPEGCLVVYWFVYTPTGDPLFLLGVLPVDGDVAEGELNYFSGQSFGSFIPRPDDQVWGTLKLRFNDCNSGFASYDADSAFSEYGSGTFPIDRLAFVGEVTCARAAGIENVPANALTGHWSGDAPIDGINGKLVLDLYILASGETFFQGSPPYLAKGDVSGNGASVLTAHPIFGATLPGGQDEVTLQLDAQFADRLEGTFEVPGNDGPLTGTLALDYESSFGRDASLSRIDGRWFISIRPGFGGNIKIEPDGALASEAPFASSQDVQFGCELTGSVSPHGTGQFNLYDANIELTGCENGQFNGIYTGIASVDDLTPVLTDKRIVFRLDNGQWAFLAGGVKLDDLPE